MDILDYFKLGILTILIASHNSFLTFQNIVNVIKHSNVLANIYNNIYERK